MHNRQKEAEDKSELLGIIARCCAWVRAGMSREVVQPVLELAVDAGVLRALLL